MSGHGGSRPGAGRKRKLPEPDTSAGPRASEHGGACPGAGRPRKGLVAVSSGLSHSQEGVQIHS